MTADVTYQKELFITLMPELPRLFQRHYDEVALDKDRMPLNPAWKSYVNLEIQGLLHILTLRVEGVLAGYAFNMVYPHLHHADIMCAFSDMFYVSPEHRCGANGVRLFTENEKMLQAAGVKKIFITTRLAPDLRKVMKRLKYRFIGRIFSKWL